MSIMLEYEYLTGKSIYEKWETELLTGKINNENSKTETFEIKKTENAHRKITDGRKKNAKKKSG